MKQSLRPKALCTAMAGLIFCSNIATGALIEFQGSPSQVITVGEIKVPVYNEARVHIGPQTAAGFPVYLTGAVASE